MKPAAHLAWRPHPHWEKVPWCASCRLAYPGHGEVAGRGTTTSMIAIFLTSVLVVIRSWGRPGAPFVLGLTFAILLPPGIVLAIGARRAVHPERPGGLRHRGWPDNWRTRELTGWAKWAWAFAALGVLYAFSQLYGWWLLNRGP